MQKKVMANTLTPDPQSFDVFVCFCEFYLRSSRDINLGPAFAPRIYDPGEWRTTRCVECFIQNVSRFGKEEPRIVWVCV